VEKSSLASKELPPALIEELRTQLMTSSTENDDIIAWIKVAAFLFFSCQCVVHFIIFKIIL